MTFLRQDLNTNLSCSHSQRYCLFFLVRGRRLGHYSNLQGLGAHILGYLDRGTLNLDDLSVGEHPGPDGGPVGVDHLFMGYLGTGLETAGYSAMQSSYVSISFMQGVVSITLGTEAGMFP